MAFAVNVVIKHQDSLVDEMNLNYENTSNPNKKGYSIFCFDSCSGPEIGASAVIDQIGGAHNKNLKNGPLNNAFNNSEKSNLPTNTDMREIHNVVSDMELSEPDVTKKFSSKNLLDESLLFGELILFININQLYSCIMIVYFK